MPDTPTRPRRVGLSASILVSIVLLSLALGGPSATADELSDVVAQRKAIAARIQAQRAQVEQLAADQQRVAAAITAAKRKVDGINANLVEVEAEVATIRAGIALARRSVGDLDAQLAKIDRQLRVLQAEQVRRQTKLVERRSLLAERVRAAYDAGRVSLLETILSARSFADALAQVGYYLDIGSQDEELARQIGEDIGELATLQQEIRGTRADTELLRDEVASRKAELDANLRELNDAQSKLSELRRKAAAALASERAQYDRLAKNKDALRAAIAKSSAARASLTARIDELVTQKRQEREQRIREARQREERERREQADRPPRAASSPARGIPSRYSGTLIWPLSGYVSQEYGCTGFSLEPARGNCAGFHSGIDIVAPYGAPIRAAGPGEVVYVGWNYADGPDPAWIVVLAHSDGLQTWYAHMQPTTPVRAGQWVEQGQIVGYEGNTGRSTGAHLHWMVRANGEFLNPRLFV